MEKDINSVINSSKQIKRGAIMSYVAIFFNIIAGIIYTPWMIRNIGQSDYGLYTLALTLISFFTIDFGLGGAVSRFLTKYNAENNLKKKRDFLGIAFKIYIIIDILILLVLSTVFIFAGVIYAKLIPEELLKFRVVFFVAGLYSIASFPFMPLDSVLISHERFAFQKFADILNKMFTVLTMVVVLLLGYRLYSLIIVNVITNVLTLILKYGYVRNNKLISVNFKASDKLLLKEIFGFSVWTSIISIAQRFILNITPTVLAAFSGSIQISLFSIAMTMEGYTWTFANALNGLFLPKVTRMTIKNDNPIEIENLMIKVGRIQLVLVGLLIIGMITMGKEFMVLWMGKKFLDSYYVMVLLIAPCIITLTQEIGYITLVALNEIKYRAFCSLTVAGISIVLSVFFSQIWGAIGSGIAIFIGNVIGNIIGMNIVYYKILKINVFHFFYECYIKMCIPLLLMIGIGFLVQYVFPVGNLFLFMFKAGMFGIIYMLLMWALALNESEKSLFLDILKRTFQIFRRKPNVQK